MNLQLSKSIQVIENWKPQFHESWSIAIDVDADRDIWSMLRTNEDKKTKMKLHTDSADRTKFISIDAWEISVQREMCVIWPAVKDAQAQEQIGANEEEEDAQWIRLTSWIGRPTKRAIHKAKKSYRDTRHLIDF